uniref:Uncharacterized protein n=1 Tax=Anguilla anguilla TaxID=7936 RepID=A0A0E9W763_ANGAN
MTVSLHLCRKLSGSTTSPMIRTIFVISLTPSLITARTENWMKTPTPRSLMKKLLELLMTSLEPDLILSARFCHGRSCTWLPTLKFKRNSIKK